MAERFGSVGPDGGMPIYSLRFLPSPLLGELYDAVVLELDRRHQERERIRGLQPENRPTREMIEAVRANICAARRQLEEEEHELLWKLMLLGGQSIFETWQRRE